jgi:NAD(P)-dependent dehydrogenase (short-subunit alcohol dehydrogenase family)
MAARLAGKTALVTGATSNIGRAIAVAFATEGAHVIVSGRSVARGAEVVEQIRTAGGRANFVAADLDGSPTASRDLATEATRVLGGRIDILVNNAGIFPRSTTATTDEATFDEVYSVNVKAPYFLTGAIAPVMAEAGGGAIINLGLVDRPPRYPQRPLQLHQGSGGDLDQSVGGGVRTSRCTGQRHFTWRHPRPRPRRLRPRHASGRNHDARHSRGRKRHS